MRRKIGAALRKQVLAEFKQKLPMFKQIKSSWGRGELLFEWQNDSGPQCFLLLFIDEKWDNFTFNIAWSEDGKFPMGIQAIDEEPKYGSKIFQIVDFWNNPKRDLWWWHLGKVIPDERALDFSAYMEPDPPVEESIAKVPEAVADVIAKIKEYVFPYFEKVVAQHHYVEKVLRPKIGTALQEHVLAAFKKELPMLRQIPRSTEASWDLLLFEWGNLNAPRCFVRLRVGYQVHKFTFDIAWSMEGIFPPKPLQTIDRAPRAGAKLFQASDFWMDPMIAEGYWWYIGEFIPLEKTMDISLSGEEDPGIQETISRIPEAVSDAISRIKEFVIPYFEKIAEGQAKGLKTEELDRECLDLIRLRRQN
jgi:hypothetical protein